MHELSRMPFAKKLGETCQLTPSMGSLLVEGSLLCKGLLSVSLALALLLCSGCSDSSEAPATPRAKKFTPIEGLRDRETGITQNHNLRFLTPDHFGCFVVNVQQVRQNESLAEVPWSELEEQLAPWLGEKNAQLSKFERVWIALDRQSLTMQAGAMPRSPVVFIIDFNSAVDQADLEAAIASRAKLSSGESSAAGDDGAEFAIKSVTDRRIALGQASMIAKIQDNSGSFELGEQLKRMPLSADLEGAISLTPIRSTLQSFFNLLAQFGGDSFAPFKKLPDTLQRIELRLSLDAKQLVELTATIDDEELPQQIVRLFDEVSKMGGEDDEGAMGLGSLLGGLGGESDTMLTGLASPKKFELVSQEIKEQELFQFKASERKVTLTLDRPTDFAGLVAASIADGKRQFGLMQRVEQMERVGQALKLYHEQYGCLPPQGSVAADSRPKSPNGELLPAQFNWRVGLLPLLDEQELYDRFDFSKPWDDPANLAAAQRIPDVYFGVTAAAGDVPSSRLHVLSGRGIYQNQADVGVLLASITDLKTSTAIVMEGSAETAVAWTSPRSFDVQDIDVAVFGNQNEGGVLLINAAFDVRAIKRKSEKVDAVLTPAGGERLTRRDFIRISQPDAPSGFPGR